MNEASIAIIKSEIVEVCHKLYSRGLVAGTDGNVSARLQNGNILITPTSLNKGDVQAQNLILLAPDGKLIEGSGKPSTEVKMHLFIYTSRPDVSAIVHAHPPYATAFAAARVPIDAHVLPEISLMFGTIPLAPYATPSTEEVPQSIAPFVASSNALLLSNHGAVTFASSVHEAYLLMEKLEQAAHILFLAHLLGGAKALTENELNHLRSVGKEFYRKELFSIQEDLSQ
ncbi:MAG: class II aldolase/adducin family protein [Bacteroidota bacterium]